MIGHNLLDTSSGEASSSSDDDDDSDDSWFDKASDAVKDEWEDLKNDVKEGINNITGSIADELAETLGISEWYSLHILDACEGYYKPNATSPGAGYNVTNCTDSDPNCK